jgi:hypothetical protein
VARGEGAAVIVRLLKWLLGGLLLAAIAFAAWDVATYDRQAWRSDFDRLKRDMAQGYANLDWIARHRRLDVAALARATEARLDGAHSRLRGWFALRDFIEAFDDPHFRVEDRGKGLGRIFVSSKAAAPPPATASCAAAGYREGEHGFEFPFVKLPGWRVVAEGNFHAGLAGDTGIVRIAQLGENQYLSACERVFKPGVSERALQLNTRRLLQSELRERIAMLKRGGARRLLVDVTGNGGGSEWVNEVTALLTGRTLTRAGARLVGPACDRRAIWEGRPPPCPIFRPAPAEPALIRGTGEWQGPLLVLADDASASAAEDLVGWVKEGGAGRIVGARTAGAGCGYVNGGTRTSLAVLPVDVRMPNCARFLKDGTNEIEGIAPDVALPMEEPERAAEALARLLAGR